MLLILSYFNSPWCHLPQYIEHCVCLFLLSNTTNNRIIFPVCPCSLATFQSPWGRFKFLPPCRVLLWCFNLANTCWVWGWLIPQFATSQMVLRRTFLPSIQPGKVSGKCHMEPKQKKHKNSLWGSTLLVCWCLFQLNPCKQLCVTLMGESKRPDFVSYWLLVIYRSMRHDEEPLVWCNLEEQLSSAIYLDTLFGIFNVRWKHSSQVAPWMV